MNDKHNRIERVENLGVGCFIFNINITEEKMTSEVIVDITEKLRNIPGLSSLIIKQDYNSPSRLPAGDIDLTFLDICFDIDLSSDPEYSFANEDKYRVMIKAFYDMPITIVLSKFATDAPSDGVVQVRRFLQKYLQGTLTLKNIGPSPFHADFFINRGKQAFTVDIVKSRGYDTVNICSTKNKTSEIITEFFEEMGDELNFFYMLKEIDIKRAEIWGEVETNMDRVNPEDGNWFKRKLMTTINMDKYLHKAMNSIIAFEANSITFQQVSESRLVNTYNTEKKYLISYTEKEKPHIYPIEAIKRLLDFHILVHSQKREGLRTTINTIFNVILTAVVTYLFFTIGIQA